MKIFRVFLVIVVLCALVVIGLLISAVISYQNTKARQSEQTATVSPWVNESQALEKIKALPEVREYEAELARAGKRASFNVEDIEGEWAVQVFEVVQQGDSHTATFNWYRVNKTTGSIMQEF